MRRLAAAGGAGDEVELEVAAGQPGLLALRLGRAAQHRLEPRRELGEGEGLDDVVVGAGAQARHPLVDGAHRGQQDRRGLHRPRRAPLFRSDRPSRSGSIRSRTSASKPPLERVHQALAAGGGRLHGVAGFAQAPWRGSPGFRSSSSTTRMRRDMGISPDARKAGDGPAFRVSSAGPGAGGAGVRPGGRRRRSSRRCARSASAPRRSWRRAARRRRRPGVRTCGVADLQDHVADLEAGVGGRALAVERGDYDTARRRRPARAARAPPG